MEKVKIINKKLLIRAKKKQVPKKGDRRSEYTFFKKMTQDGQETH